MVFLASTSQDGFFIFCRKDPSTNRQPRRSSFAGTTQVGEQVAGGDGQVFTSRLQEMTTHVDAFWRSDKWGFIYRKSCFSFFLLLLLCCLCVQMCGFNCCCIYHFFSFAGMLTFSLSPQHRLWWVPPGWTRWQDLRAAHPAAWPNLQRQQTVRAHVWTRIPALSIHGRSTHPTEVLVELRLLVDLEFEQFEHLLMGGQF